MKLFRRRQRAQAHLFFPAIQAVRGQLHLLKIQIVNLLSNQERKMTLPQKKIAISAFLFITGFLLVGLLYTGLYGRGVNRPNYLHIPGISRPISPQLPDSIQDRIRRYRTPRLRNNPSHSDTNTKK
jgi:hypothetical protein